MTTVYLREETWAHRIPAKWKLLFFALSSTLLLSWGTTLVFLIAFASVLVAYASLGPEGVSQLKILYSLKIFIAVLIAVHFFFGAPMEGVLAVLRLGTMILAAHFVSITTRMDDMLEAVMPLFYPLTLLGFSSRKPALSVALVLRFIPYLLFVFSSLRSAYKARTGRENSWKLVAPLAIQSLRMSDHVAEALTARGGAEGLAKPRE